VTILKLHFASRKNGKSGNHTAVSLSKYARFWHTLRVTSNLWFVLEKLGKKESEIIFKDLLQEIKKISPALLKTKKFSKDIPFYEAQYFEYFCGIGDLPTPSNLNYGISGFE
jgi:hypothetical protein